MKIKKLVFTYLLGKRIIENFDKIKDFDIQDVNLSTYYSKDFGEGYLTETEAKLFYNEDLKKNHKKDTKIIKNKTLRVTRGHHVLTWGKITGIK